jgi:mono/diheme cytochrome c family protein
MRTRKAWQRGAAIAMSSALFASVVVSAAYAADGKPLYEKSCVGCHGASGKGDGPAGKALKPPPQDFAAVLKGKSEADIAKVIKEGGKAVGKSAMMPAYGSKLSDDQIQAVTQYVKSLAK